MVAPEGTIDIAGWLEKLGNPFRWTKIDDLGMIISGGVGLAIIIAGVLFLAWFVWGAVEWLTSGGEPESVKKARERLTHAGIGLGLILAAWAVFVIVQRIFGITFWVGEGEVGAKTPYTPCSAGQINCCQATGKMVCCQTPGARTVGGQCVRREDERVCHFDFQCILPK